MPQPVRPAGAGRRVSRKALPMQRTGTVNYHVHKAERQAFEIDVGGIPGNLVSPELVTMRVSLADLRDGRTEVSFGSDGFAFVRAPSEVADFDTGAGWQDVYDRELAGLLRRDLGAADVVVFDHTLRTDDPDAERRPARHVHSDYSREGAESRLVDILGAKRAAEWGRGHYAFVNLWRPVEHPINSAPLGFVRPSTVEAGDWIRIDLVYPDRRGQIMGLAAGDRHEWVYLSRMTPDEVVYFNIYDNTGSRRWGTVPSTWWNPPMSRRSARASRAARW